MYITNKIKSNKKEYFTIFLAIIINAILFLYALSKGTSYYITNDDYRLRLISSGAYTGDRSALSGRGRSFCQKEVPCCIPGIS